MTRIVAGLVLCATIVAACGSADGAAPATTVATTMAATTTSLPPPTATTTTLPDTTSTSTSSPMRSGPGPGGMVTIGDDQSPPTLNPYSEGGDNFIVGLIAQALHTGVWDVDASLQRIPDVVVELPGVSNGGLTVNEDGSMTVRYQIRDEAVWADGTPISGEDFAFTYATLTAPEFADAQFGAFEDYQLIVPDSVEVGAKTFAFTMPQATLAHERLFRWLIPRHQVEGSNILDDWNEHPWLSGGPFVFDSWDRGGSDGIGSSPGSITLVRNENYWKSDPETGDPLPHLDGVVYRFIPETESLLRAFAGRELDVINPPPSLEGIDALRALTEDGAIVQIRPGPVWEHFSFQFGELNRNPDSLNRFVTFRRAVAHAIDRDAIATDLLSSYGDALSSYVDVFTPSLSGAAWDRYDYDPDEARRLLTELCAELERDCGTEPPKVMFSTTSNAEARPRIADHVAAMLGDAGIEVELQLEDSQLYFGETLSRGTWDMGLWAWVGQPGWLGIVEIHDVFDPDAPPPDGSNYYRWGTPAASGTMETFAGSSTNIDVAQGPSSVRDEHTARFAELVDAMNATVDESELAALVAEAESILADQVVVIPLYSRLVVGAHWGDEIAGVTMNPSQAGHTWNIEEWYRVDR